MAKLIDKQSKKQIYPKTYLKKNWDPQNYQQ